MMMAFERIDIPAAAIMQHQIFFDASRKGALELATEGYFRNNGGDRGDVPSPPWRQIQYLSLFYLVVLYPKELIRVKEIKDEVLRLVKESLDSALLARLGDMNSFHSLLRNAVAHADIQIDNDKGVLINHRQQKISISFEEADKIISAFGNAYLHVRQNPQHRRDIEGGR